MEVKISFLPSQAMEVSQLGDYGGDQTKYFVFDLNSCSKVPDEYHV